MAKIDCYHIGKSNKIETPTFKAYKYKDKETKEITLYPIIDKECNEVFIHGVGWKKIGKSKLVEIPVFDREEDHWNDYIEKYGVYCLYYSLEGDGYNFNDCAKLPQATEIRSILYTGAKGYAEFMRLYHRLNEIQRNVIEEKYLADITYNRCAVVDFKDYIFAPLYYLEYTFIPTNYQPDILKDDERLSKLWKDYRYGYLRRNSEKYQEYLRLEDERKVLLKNLCKDRYNVKLEVEYHELNHTISRIFIEVDKEINEIIRNELYIDNDKFPTSTKDRIKFIYGEEAFDIYNELVDKYLKK